jgi:hypothetical protein
MLLEVFSPDKLIKKAALRAASGRMEEAASRSEATG